jgi:hypothetical protein
MLLAHGIEKKVGICDIETMVELFDVGCYDPDTGGWTEFEVSAYKNELYQFVKWYTSKPFDFLVTFNGIAFDQQVMQWIVDNHQDWYDFDNLEITARISAYGQKVIEDSRFNIPHKYKEKDFSIPPLDVFRIHHFDNEAKRTSLKWCAFMMNMDVEEMPIHHLRRDLTLEEVRLTQAYRRNDCFVTYGVLLVTLGRVADVEEINGGHELPELKDYRGKSMIQDRYDVWRETGLWCLNWSDVKIGEEWNKQDYKHAEKIRDDEERGILFGKKVKHPYGQRFHKFFPSTMDFQTDELKNFIKMVGNQFVKAEKQEFHITIGSTRYTVAKGGLHSTEKNRVVAPPEGYNYDDLDVGSQYPNSIYKLRIYAPHLTETIMNQFKGKIEKRLIYKAKAQELKAQGEEEEARKYTSVQDMLKLCLNGGYYGKLGQKGSFLEYPEGLLKCCMSNQIEILMLIEMMEMAGFKVMSGNTDGITVLYPDARKQEFLDICKAWEKKVGNVEMGKLEHTPFQKVWQENVNHYIAKKKDGGVKKKGRFATEFLMNKNKSGRVINLAMEAYFIKGQDPMEFIKNHKNIYDFCIGRKAAGQLHYEEEWVEEGVKKTKTHKKLVRYFVSKQGTVLWKRGINFNGDEMNNQCEAPNDVGQPKVTYFNKGWKAENYDIDYDYYIYKTLKRIDKIEKSKKAESFIQKLSGTKQMSLF